MKTIYLSVIAFLLLALVSFLLPAQSTSQTDTRWWTSSAPDKITVNGLGTMQAIWPGTAEICSQPSKTVSEPKQCYTVTVTHIAQ